MSINIDAGPLQNVDPPCLCNSLGQTNRHCYFVNNADIRYELLMQCAKLHFGFISEGRNIQFFSSAASLEWLIVKQMCCLLFVFWTGLSFHRVFMQSHKNVAGVDDL